MIVKRGLGKKINGIIDLNALQWKSDHVTGLRVSYLERLPLKKQCNRSVQVLANRKEQQISDAETYQANTMSQNVAQTKTRRFKHPASSRSSTGETK
ncbi:hypothetical protein CEXT_691371 [Caerostris extrusa]|uniref:Uncharacterized protein n=1 Tax=Caerostris extrusa TaxID=172846 RepID=A0AAV4Y4L6_CAEEX|nr:hypothetical protein CEXT_691371 [Caerostris extrusa]